MKNKLITIIARMTLIAVFSFGFITLYQYNISQNAKAEAVAEEYDIPINVINKRCNDGVSIKELKADLASGEIVYDNGQLIVAEYVGW